jgi:hypothetical protein
MPHQPISLEYITKGNNDLTKLPSVPRNNLTREMAGCPQKFLPQADTTLSTCQEKKGSVRTKIIEAIYTN